MLSRKVAIFAILAIVSLALFRTQKLADSLTVLNVGLQQKAKCLFKENSDSQDATNTYGRITDKVAVITDNKYTPRLIPLILHYHSVLGPDWPIVFYTSQMLISQYLRPSSPGVSSAWLRAVEDGRIDVRIVPDEFNLTSRYGVNTYLSRPWLWEQLAPAQHVLVFQADAILCSNSRFRVEDFFEYDFIGAMLRPTMKVYNGGLSLRNRTMMLDILGDGNNWEQFYKEDKAKTTGEDVWFSMKIEERGGNLPEDAVASGFALQYKWHIDQNTRPLGYHKVHKNVPGKVRQIEKWCPEIGLAGPGSLGRV